MSQAYVPPFDLKGRGAGVNTPNRFERLRYEPDEDPQAQPDGTDEERPALKTELYRDNTRRIIAFNDSPDVSMGASLNPYRGCEHGCSYCFARPSHEYLGWSAGLDFESRILVKEDAPALLRAELSAPSWEPQTLMMSGVTDPYQPVERKLGLTRRCVEVLAEFRNPVGAITKSELITRDADLFGELAKHGAAAAFLSITTLDEKLSRSMEPRASTPQRRLAALEALTAAGVPVGVMVAPIVPGLTDHEIPAILDAAWKAGARMAGRVLLRLPWSVGPLFLEWLERVYPEKKDKVVGLLRGTRGGELYDSRYGVRQEGVGPYAEQIGKLFDVAARKIGFGGERPELSTAAFRRPAGPQLSLFD